MWPNSQNALEQVKSSEAEIEKTTLRADLLEVLIFLLE
jgi:hypothetical protein